MNKLSMKKSWAVLLLTMTGVFALNSCNSGEKSAATLGALDAKDNVYFSEPQTLGQGQIRSYLKAAQSGRPLEIGVQFGAAALEQLPQHPMENGHCFDINNDGSIDPHKECALGHHQMLPLPEEVQKLAKTPFKYVMANYNPMGHMPPGIYDKPHFDFHFYLQSNEDRLKIRLGPCAQVINCDDLQTALKPLPAGYAPADYISVRSVMGQMGDHLLDRKHSPEFNGQPFTHTWIWGVYDGKITFMEPMITLDYLRSQPQKDCTAYTMPEKFSEAGYYPTEYCTSYNKGLKQYTISLENFKYYDN